MRLVQVQIKNFKLIEDVTIDFSTNAKRPLTVIRAENGSGKTSLLYALLWAFYDVDGLTDQGELRLTSTALPIGEPVEVQVRVRFDHTDNEGEITSYQAIRTVTETPAAGDKVERDNDRFQLVRFVGVGHEDVPEELLDKLVPRRLQHIFFTNGDAVQQFISGKLSTKRDKQVRATIEALLGLNEWRETVKDLEACEAAIRSKTARESGDELGTAEQELAKTDERVIEAQQSLAEAEQSLERMTTARDQADRELTGLRGSGDLDEINEQIAEFEADLDLAEQQRAATIGKMVDLIRSEKASWYFLSEQFHKGVHALNDLRDRNIIPGTSVQVLVDRLELGLCICGEDLLQGSGRRSSVESLLQEQQQVDENRQRLSRLSYLASNSQTTHLQQVEMGEEFLSQRVDALNALTRVADVIKGKQARLKNLRERREQINEDRVRTLVTRIDGLDKKIGDKREELGGQSLTLSNLLELQTEQKERYDKALAASEVARGRITEQRVAKDLLTLASGTLSTLESDYVHRVSDRMQALFLGIVGSDPSFGGSVFTGARVSEDFNIVIESHNDRTLDPDFELNGASQRALTLAFIWATMQIADVTAPRIIDTPLGMVAGGVKSRMVEAITRPAATTDHDFQVILLLTRSEIRDVEDLLDERAGMSQTLSCSKDFPVDLVNDWDVVRPVVRSCSCNHRTSCDVCARRYDKQHGIRVKTRGEA